MTDDLDADKYSDRRLYQSFVALFAAHYMKQTLMGDEATEWIKLYESVGHEAAEDYAVRCNLRRAKRSARIAFVETMEAVIHRAARQGVTFEAPVCGTRLMFDRVTDFEEKVTCAECLKVAKEKE